LIEEGLPREFLFACWNDDAHRDFVGDRRLRNVFGGII